MKKTNFLIFFLLVHVFISSCNKDEIDNWDLGPYEVVQPENPIDKGDRLFGINISDSKYGFAASFNKATEAGIEIVEINMPWSAIELSEGNYVDPNGTFQATAFYAANNIKLGLSLAVINTVTWEIPDYLKDVDVNSQKFIDSFNNMIDWVLAALPDDLEVPFISIGNEIDLVLSSDQDWADYTAFYKEAANHIRSNYSDINVGVKTTIMGGLFGSEKTKIQLINEHSDVVMLNYYPQDNQFKVLAPDIVHQHFGNVVTAFPGKEIFLTEVGYQSGHEYCGSTETKQAHFYHNMFEAWDTYKDKIKLVIVDWLHDQSPEIIEDWKDYYGSDPALVDYLSTLGLRNYDGTDKAAWLQVVAETNARGW